MRGELKDILAEDIEIEMTAVSNNFWISVQQLVKPCFSSHRCSSAGTPWASRVARAFKSGSKTQQQARLTCFPRLITVGVTVVRKSLERQRSGNLSLSRSIDHLNKMESTRCRTWAWVRHELHYFYQRSFNTLCICFVMYIFYSIVGVIKTSSICINDHPWKIEGWGED